MTLAGNDKLLQTYWRDDIARSVVLLQAPLTSGSWSGATRSTTTKTLIDLSAVFGVPAGVRAVLVRIICSDSASLATANLYFMLSPSASSGVGPIAVRPSGLPNGYYTEAWGIVPCDVNGDIYFQCVASGVNTMAVHIQIWGYLV